MSTKLGTNGVSNTIYEFLTTSDNPALFAGAGVGARAGLPTWPQFMQHLAKVADDYDQLTGALIRKRAESGQYLSAAIVYKSCPDIPRGLRYKQMAVPFNSPPAPEKLRALVSLPFSAIFTTNYDRSLHNAFASVVGESALTVELRDSTMHGAPFLTEYYIARIHGRAEVPDTIVLTEDDYRDLGEDEYYIDLVRHALTRYSCLFLGFSFVDPSIEHIFQIIEDRLSPEFPQLHLAILGADADKTLKTRLARFNIRTVEYDTTDEHSTLWEGILEASRKFTQAQKIAKPAVGFPLEAAHRFLATSYARAKLESEIQPLRDIVMDGIIMEFLTEAGEGATLTTISENLKKYLSISNKESYQLTQRRIEILSGRGWCHVSNNVIRPAREATNVLKEDLSILVDGAIDRIVVRTGQSISSQVRKVATRCIEAILMARGWDLGAHYAGATTEFPNVLSTVSSSVEKHGARLSRQQRQGLLLACYDLFEHPDETESEVLALLGRVAFCLQLIINSPCATIAHRATLPERIYLDASVLMPAIVEGHPYRPVYVDAIHRLGEAANVAGVPITPLVAGVFLNEIISHREKGEREAEVMSLDDPEELAHHILYYGAENVNVFVSAYGSWVGRLEEKVSFAAFLHRAAPYRSEQELARYLNREGIKTVELLFRSNDEKILHRRIKHALEDAYEADRKSQYDRKPSILIEHEARQLTQLSLDLKNGIRAIFVTADKRLRKLTTGPVLGESGQALISHRGLVQLIDILVGFETDPVSFTRLYWGGGAIDEVTMILNYYTNLALQHQDEAMTMSLPEVLESLVPEATEAAKRENVSLSPSGDPESKARTAKFLDRFEDRFFANMAEVVRRRRLEEHIRETREEIHKYETKLSDSSDPKQKARYKKKLRELDNYLKKYERQLTDLQQ